MWIRTVADCPRHITSHRIASHRIMADADSHEEDGDSRLSIDSTTHLLLPSSISPPPSSHSVLDSQDGTSMGGHAREYNIDEEQRGNDINRGDVNISTNVTANGDVDVDGDGDVDAKVNETHTLRLIDTHIIPLLFLTSMFNFMDKTILSSASVFGLREDNNLHDSQYSWVSSAFYFGYLAATYPATLLVARLPVARYLGSNALFWGAVVALTAASRSFGALVTLRFLLGAAEASVSPALVFVTSTWYTRDEIPSRTGIWFSGNSAGGIVSSLLAYGLGHTSNEDGVGPWRWMFIVLGAATFLLGAILLTFLPDSIATAKFLSERERKWAADRVVVTGLGSTAKTRWCWRQMREALLDPKTWLVWALALLCQIPNGGTQNFGNIVIKSFGFTSLQSTLINIPYSVLSIASISGTGWIAGRFRSMNCILIALVVLPPIVGSALISNRAAVPHGVSLFGYFLLSTGPSALPLILSLVQSNFRGVTKKMTVTALLFIAYCAGNIAGPQLFIDAEAPTYDTAFRAILVCYSLAVGFSLGLRTYLAFVNRSRRRREGVEGSAGASGAVGDDGKVVDVRRRGSVAGAVGEVRLRPGDYEDVTDWETFGFRYRL